MVEASPTPFYSELLIDGQLLAGEGAAEAIINPATGETLTQIREASAEQVEAAILAAHRAFTDWSRTTPAQRAAVLLAIADAIEQRAAPLARRLLLELGPARRRVEAPPASAGPTRLIAAPFLLAEISRGGSGQRPPGGQRPPFPR